MNKRQEELLTILLIEKDYINVKVIAQRLECSERTIRNHCNDINLWLGTFSGASIKKKANLGIKLKVEDKERNIISQKLSREVKRANSDIHKHIEILALILLSGVKKVTIADIGDALYTNKNIVREELMKMSEGLKGYGLELNTKKNSGVTITGDERNIRSMLVDYIYSYIDKYRLNIDELGYFHASDLIIVTNLMNMIEENMNLRFTDASFRQLILFLLITIIRVRTKNTLNEPDDLVIIENISIIDEIEEKLKSNLLVFLNENEKRFISSLVLSMNVQVNNSKVKEELKLNKELMEYTKELIELVSLESGINFSEDKLLLEQLLCHLNSTIWQLKNNVNMQNPLLSEIKSKYCFLFTIISDVVRRNDSKKNISEDEIGYLVLHFQVSLERKKKKIEDIKKISIVCPLSFGLSTLLKVKIEKKFENIQVVETIREEDLKRRKFNKDIDFLVCFREYEDLDIPMFITTHLFTENDQEKLKIFINSMNKNQKSYKTINKLMISDYFIRDLECDDVYEAIKELGNILSKKHYIDKEYIASMIEREKNYPTNIGGGILLPHGDSKYVNESVICLARLKNPIKIKNGDLIDLVLMVIYKNDDREEFQRLFTEISELTEDSKMLELIKMSDIKEIKQILI